MKKNQCQKQTATEKPTSKIQTRSDRNRGFVSNFRATKTRLKFPSRGVSSLRFLMNLISNEKARMKIYLGFGRHDIAHETKFFFLASVLCASRSAFSPRFHAIFFPFNFSFRPPCRAAISWVRAAISWVREGVVPLGVSGADFDAYFKTGAEV